MHKLTLLIGRLIVFPFIVMIISGGAIIDIVEWFIKKIILLEEDLDN